VATAAGKPIISSEIVEEAAEELAPKDASPYHAGPGPPSIRRNRTTIATTMAAGLIAAGIVIYPLREQAPDIMATAAMPAEGEAGPFEGRSGNAAPVRDRPRPEPRLAGASYHPPATPIERAMPAQAVPLPAALAPDSPNSWQVAQPCREMPVAAAAQGRRCANSPDRAGNGQVAGGEPITPENERLAEPLEVAFSVAGAEPSAPADIPDPIGDSAAERHPQLFVPISAAIEASDLAGQAVSAQAEELQQADQRNDLVMQPEIDLENAAPAATTATDDTDAALAATPAPEVPADTPLEAEGSGDEEQPTAAETRGTNDLDQAQPGQASDGEQAGAAAPSRAALPQGNDLAAEEPGQAPVANPGEPDDVRAKASEEGSPLAAGPEQSAQSSDADVPGSAVAEGQQTPAGDTGTSGVAPSPEANPQNSAAPAAMPAVTKPAASPMPAEIIAALMKRGDELLRIGDISAARLLYERAASGGSARAMTALGMTHDPSFLGGANVRGIRPDPAIAMEWYRKAAALGDAEAAARIQQLPAAAR
jgi:hypothetical protein